MNLKGKTAIVTGGGAGFGLGLVRELVNHGSNVVIFDSSAEAIDSLQIQLPTVKSVLCDVSDDKQVDKSVIAAIEYFGSVDILVNNAGIMKSAALVNPLSRGDKRHSRDLWHQVIDVNLNSAFYLGSTVADHMLQMRIKGVIINVSSISAAGNAGQSAYSASKAAVEALTAVWAKELAPFGIRSAAVAPGFIKTKGANEALEKKYLEDWISRTPLRRSGEINEVVDAILFCIKNDFFNGRVLSLDGGLVI